MKNRIFGSAVALIAAANLLFVGAAAHATTYTPELVHTFNTESNNEITDINAVGNKVVFEYDSGIWVSDGTDAGTVELTLPEFLTDWNLQHDQWYQYTTMIGSDLYFMGYNDDEGSWQVYKTDGATITQVTTGGGYDDFYLLKALGGNLYLWAEPDGAHNSYTHLVKVTTAGVETDIANGNNDNGDTSEDPTQLQLIGTKVIFSYDPTNNSDYGIYAYDVDTEEIVELNGANDDLYDDSDYIPDPNDAWTVFNGEVYYAAQGANGIGVELFATDGTDSGTRLVADLNTSSNSDPSSDWGNCRFAPVTLGDYFYFPAINNDDETVLFKSDGTDANSDAAVSGSVAVNPGCRSAAQPPVLNGKIIIDMSTDEVGNELFATDGTDAGTVLLKDIREGSDSSIGVRNWTSHVLFDGHVFFIANDYANSTDNQEVWVTDGTSAGTVKVSDFSGTRAVGNYDDSTLVVAGDNMFFAALNYSSEDGDGTISLYKLSAQGGLAATGVDAGASLWAGFGLLVAGVAVVTVRRRLVK